MVYVIGVNTGRAASHDASACLIGSAGQVLAFVEEERISRVRHAPGQLPSLAIERCLRIAGITRRDVAVVAVGWDEPRLAPRYGGDAWEFGSSVELLQRLGFPAGERQPDLYFVPHHRAHAASAFHASPYEEAAVLVVDGNGENESISIFSAARNQPLICQRSWPRVNSLGYMYEAVSEWLGLGRLNAGKTMGLAAYGRGNDGSKTTPPGWIGVRDGDLACRLGTDPLLDYDDLMRLWGREIEAFAGTQGPTQPTARLASDMLAVRVAWAAQSELETAITWLAAEARKATGHQPLCIAGGVGLNCAANGRLDGPVFVPPVPHDAGVALGAAWAVVAPKSRAVMSAYTGSLPGTLPPDLRDDWQVEELHADPVAKLILDGRVGAVCRGRSEVGPRALCHRSIVASPVFDDMQRKVNQLKRREQWRPFGPVTHVDHDYWTSAGDLERYMVGAAMLSEHGARTLPAVSHIDNTTRPQRLGSGDEPFVGELLDVLRRSGHPPVLINTSFNGPGEPIVDSAAEAIGCAARLGLDFLVVDDWLLTPRARGAM
jgi:carbamoyltransferase